MDSIHNVHKPIRSGGGTIAPEDRIEEKVRWHGTWRGETLVQLDTDLDIAEKHLCIYGTDPRGDSPIPERIFVLTGPKDIHLRHAILDWAAQRGISIT